MHVREDRERYAPGMTSRMWTSELEFALATARRAGDSTLAAFHQGSPETDNKSDGSIVTQTDLATERWLRSVCARQFPDDGFLGEEFAEVPGTSDRRWIVDPIDGTFSFANGVPLYGTLLALEVDGISRVGVIHMPALRETVFAAEGLGAWWLKPGSSTPTAARFRMCDSTSQALACATSPDYFTSPAQQALLPRLCAHFGSTRGWSDCYAHVLAATGRVDAVIEPVVRAWDIAPMTVIHREAGGMCTDWNGTETAHNGQCIATGGRIHNDVLTLLKPTGSNTPA